MEIIRGIVGENNRQELKVMSVAAMSSINNQLEGIKLKIDDKLLGVIINNKFNICYNIGLKNGQNQFGYVFKMTDNNYEIQTFEGFDKNQFNPFDANYILGKELSISISEIEKMGVSSY